MKPVTTTQLGSEQEKSLRVLLRDAAVSMGLSLEIWKSPRRGPERLVLGPACSACETEKPRLFDRCRKRRTYLARPASTRPLELAEKCSLGLRLASSRAGPDAPVLFAFGYTTIPKEHERQDERVLALLHDVQRLLAKPNEDSTTQKKGEPEARAQQLLRSVTREETNSDTTIATVQAVLPEVRDALDASYSFVWVRKGGLLELSSATPQDETLLAERRETWQAFARERTRSLDHEEGVGRWNALPSDHPIAGWLGTPSDVIAVPLQIDQGIAGVLCALRTTRTQQATRVETTALDGFASRVEHAIGIDALTSERHRFVTRTVRAMVSALDARAQQDAGHSDRVHSLCMWMANEMDLSGEDREALYWSSLLHDIGKMSIPDRVLHKVGRLDRAETLIMNEHPMRGWEILSGVPELRGAADAVRSHHERWDGGGYPEGLAAESIPRPARIVAVADAFDAILSGRTPNRAHTPRTALEILESESAQQFDPQVLAVLRGLLPLLEQHAWVLLSRPGPNPSGSTS